MSSLDVARAELALAVLYLNKAEARDKICRAIQYGSRFVSDGKPGTAQNVEKSTSLARKVFRLFKVLLGSNSPMHLMFLNRMCLEILGKLSVFTLDSLSRGNGTCKLLKFSLLFSVESCFVLIISTLSHTLFTLLVI